MFGLTVEEASGETVELWPDNLLAVNAFIAMSTQWRVGMNGPTGLDYNALPLVLRSVGVKKKAQPEVFELVRVLEETALMQMRADRK